MKTVFSNVSNYSKNKIIIFLYRKEFFYRTNYFQFAEPLISAKLNLVRTAIWDSHSVAYNSF